MINEFGEYVEEVFDDIEEFVTDVAEELFQPRKGGLVDRQRALKAAEHEAHVKADEFNNNQPLKNDKRKLHVLTTAAPIGSGQTVVIASTFPVIRILGADPNRKRSVVTAIDAAVILTQDSMTASDPRNSGNTSANGNGGYYLAAGASLVIESAAEVWAAYVSETTRISIWTESYGND